MASVGGVRTRWAAVLLVLLVAGGARSAAAETCGDWSQIAPTPPFYSLVPTTALDPVRGRIVQLLDDTTFPVTELWTFGLDDHTWTSLTVTGLDHRVRPIFRRMIYDPVRDRLLVFGGHGDFDDSVYVWVMPLTGTPTWTELHPAGLVPAFRVDPAIVYDSVHDRLLMFGGNVMNQGNTQELWELTLGSDPAWHLLATQEGPPPPVRCAAFDSTRDRTLVLSGDGRSWSPARRSGPR
jgi:hypothetical protein